MLQGERIRMERLARHISQRELGALIGKDQAYVSRLERGAFPGITIDTLESLADALGVSTDYLLGRTTREEDEDSHAA